ncbi:MAG TPA: protein-glutamate O-methyltransferase CheR [Nitrospiria bacterium]|nr:protein-glutamate O-methyltransferase CheR [Nitrospiria bacterium]
MTAITKDIFSPDGKIQFSDDTFHQFQELMFQKSGVTIENHAKEFVRSRLMNSVLMRQFSDFRDYFYFLKYDKDREAEIDKVIDLLTIHETYFFREMAQLETFSGEILDELIEKNRTRKTIRIWSAGCSTGEEPYTIAMLMQERKDLRDWRCEIFATDISSKVLDSARKGLYFDNSFRAMQDDYLLKYFTPENGGFRIKEEIRKQVIFNQGNLADFRQSHFLNEMDLVFCRNVIIYFNLEIKKKVISNFYERLKPGGFLLLGHSESLSYVTPMFDLRHFKKDMVYYKNKVSAQ